MKISVVVLIVLAAVVVLGTAGYILLGPEPAPPRDYVSRQNHLRALETAGLVRSAVMAHFWKTRAAGGPGNYPKTLEGSMFLGGEIPRRDFGVYSWTYDPDTGEVGVVMSGYGKVRLQIKEMFSALLSPFFRDGESAE